MEEDDGEDVNKSSTSDSEGEQSEDSVDKRFIDDEEAEVLQSVPTGLGVPREGSEPAEHKQKRRRLQHVNRPGPSTAVQGPPARLSPSVQPGSAVPGPQSSRPRSTRKRPIQTYMESSEDEAQTSQLTPLGGAGHHDVIVISDSD